MCQTLNSSIKVHYYISHTTASPSRVTVFAYTRRKLKAVFFCDTLTNTHTHTSSHTVCVCALAQTQTNFMPHPVLCFRLSLVSFIPLDVLFENGLPPLWALRPRGLDF